jgi:hypothetical protein
MKVLFFLCLFFVFLFLAGHVFNLWKIANLRAKGIYPAQGKEQQEDVLKLLKFGEKPLAIRCYRAIYNVSLKEAQKQVKLLEL